MARTTGTGMRLRNRIVRPVRYEDDPDVHARRRSFGRPNGSQPAFPELLAQQVIHFDPNHPPAAFPSLPLTQQQTQDGGLVQPKESETLQPEIASSLPQASTFLDVSQLVDESGEDNVVDFTMSNNIAAGDTSGVDALNTDYEGSPEESVQWGSLELAFQHRIFCALCKSGDEEQAVRWLSLAEVDATAIQKAVAWRKKHPITLTQQHGSQVNWLEPRLLSKYSGYMNRIISYELGSSMQLLRAGMFLQQVNLPLELLGIWDWDPFGSGDLVEVTPIVRLFPVSLLSPRQLQQVFMHGAPDLRPPVIPPEPVATLTEEESSTVNRVQGNQPQHIPRKIVKLKYGKRQPTGRPVGRPRKQRPASTTQPEKTETMPIGDSQQKKTLADTTVGNGAAVSRADRTDPSADDAAIMLDLWTRPLPDEINRTLPSVTDSDEQDTVSRSAGLASVASDQKATDEASVPELQIHPALLLPADTVQNNARPSSGAAPSPAVAKPPRLKLKMSATGVASVASTSPTRPPITATGKLPAYFAATPSLGGGMPNSRTTFVNPSLPPWSTPKSIRLKVEEPERAEDNFKTSTREVPSLSSSSPTRFGEENNFGTDLLLHRRPATPDTSDLGVFASAEDHGDRQSSPVGPSGTITPDMLRQARDWAREEGSPTPVRRLVLAGTGTPKADEVVRSIEEDVDMPDAPALEQQRDRTAYTQQSPLAGRGPVAREDRDGGRRSPSPPRSISPISVNEDFEEYQSWLRGETESGPMPQSLVDLDQTSASQTLAGQAAPAQKFAARTPPVQAQAFRSLAATPQLDDPGSKIVKLRIAVTNEELMEASRLNAMGSDFIDPGEEGDAEWEEPARKKEKPNTPKKTSAKKPSPKNISPETASSKKTSPKKVSPKKTAPNQAIPKQSTPRTTLKSSAATNKAPTKKKSAANQELLKRATRAHSLAVSEVSDTPRTRSRSSTPVPSSDMRVSSTSKRKRTESVEPRRSFRLSSAELTDDGETSRPVARQKKDSPLRAKATPVSRLRKSMTPSQTTDVASSEDQVDIAESVLDVNLDTTAVSASTGKPRKKWSHKTYEKTRESSRLADMDVPNMKV